MAMLDGVKRFYELHYKVLLVIPFVILFLAIGQIAYQIATTGDFVNKGVTLKGGSLVSFVTERDKVDPGALQAELQKEFAGREVGVRTLGSSGSVAGVVIESDIAEDDELERLINKVMAMNGVQREDVSVEIIGSSLGGSFFYQSIIALLTAFVLMGVVVFLYFRTPVPSLAVILAAFSDIVVTLSVFNLTGERLSSAGIAALLMLIGYSVDTDILLTSRVLKKTELPVMERVYSAISTGLSMTATALAAILVAFIFVKSEVISQIMLILLIGLTVDMVFTWIQNVGILRLYVERRGGERK